MRKNNQSGFGAVGVILILVVILAIGGVGYMVWRNNDKKTPSDSASNARTSNEDSEASTPSSSPAPVQQGNYVNVIQADQTITQVSPDKIAKTEDQAKILQDLHETCKDPNNSNVTVNHIVFDGNSNFKQAGNYAYINISVCHPVYKSLSEIGGSGRGTYVHKNSTGTWIVDAATQMGAPQCDQVDGKGYPASLVPSCSNTDGSSRTPS